MVEKQELVTSLVEMLQNGASQIPQILQEFILMKRVESIIDVIVSICIVLGCYYYIKHVVKNFENIKNDVMEYLTFISIVLFSIIGLVFAIQCVFSLYEVAKVWLTPNAYILDYILKHLSSK